MAVIRSFVAVSLGRPVERAVGAAIDELRGALCDVRWVRPENAHLTLQFHGDVEQESLPALKAALGEAARAVEPFRVTVAGGGAFPSATRARVLWIGVDDPEQGLARLATAVQRASEPLGHAVEARPYTPHLTIGRARGQTIRGAADVLAGLAGRSFGEADIHEIILFRSDLGPHGADYSVQASWIIGDRANGGAEGQGY